MILLIRVPLDWDAELAEVSQGLEFQIIGGVVSCLVGSTHCKTGAIRLRSLWWFLCRAGIAQLRYATVMGKYSMEISWIIILVFMVSFCMLMQPNIAFMIKNRPELAIIWIQLEERVCDKCSGFYFQMLLELGTKLRNLHDQVDAKLPPVLKPKNTERAP